MISTRRVVMGAYALGRGNYSFVVSIPSVFEYKKCTDYSSGEKIERLERARYIRCIVKNPKDMK